MRVLIADKLPATGVAAIAALGVTVDARPELGADDLAGVLRETGAEVLVVRSTKVTADAFAAAPRLGLVVRAGAGVNTIDVAAANRHAVFVANCPGKNAIAVAELTMGLILALDRRIVDATLELRHGTWNKSKYGKARGLKGQTLGLVGFGLIAREVAHRARAFGMKLLCCDAHPVAIDLLEADGVVQVPDLDTLLDASDIVSVHVPYSKATHHLIGADQLARLRPGATVIHTSRGGVVDDHALAAAVAAGKLRAGLDVFEGEPAGGQADFKNVTGDAGDIYGTPHIGASTEQAETAIADEVVRIIESFVARGIVHHAVNLTDRSARYSLVVRHLDRVGVLAGILMALREERVNVQGMSNTIFAGGEAACATITFEQAPSDECLQRLRDHEAILAVELRAARA
jgi:D-3-phosphoglycerate dehydrogenase